MNILDFKTFESYLKSSRYLLYHTTLSQFRFIEILKGDMLKAGQNARGPKGVCFTRNSMWTADGSGAKYRFVFDTDKMIRAGYRPHPLVELYYDIGASLRNTRKNMPAKIKGWKGDLDWYKQGVRQAPHNIDTLPQDKKMEIEFEERVLKDLNRMSRFLVYIDIYSIDDLEIPEFQEYLKAHPHIEVREILNPMNASKVKLIENPILVSTKKELEKV